MDHYVVVQDGGGRFLLVAEGEPPLPATFDERAKAQAVADRLNAHYAAGATALHGDKDAATG